MSPYRTRTLEKIIRQILRELVKNELGSLQQMSTKLDLAVLEEFQAR
jgi:hypothetical protein